MVQGPPFNPDRGRLWNAQVRFLGRVLPRSYGLRISVHQTLTWILDTGAEATLYLNIVRGVIEVDCAYSGQIDRDILTVLYFRARAFCQTAADLASFSTGIGHTVILDKGISLATGQYSEAVSQDLSLAGLCTAYDIRDEVSILQTANMVISDPRVALVLHDLISGVTNLAAAPINFFRAIEGIRHLIAPGLEPANQWPLMNEALRLSKSYVDPVRINATQWRHGNREQIPGLMVREMGQRAWTIMDRFLEYKKRGSTPLPQSEFPTLI